MTFHAQRSHKPGGAGGMLCDGRREWKAFLPIEPHVFVDRPGFGVANVREAWLTVRTLSPRLELDVVDR